MSNYDLGSIGWTVKTNGTAESISDLGRLHDKLLSAEASAAVFEKAFQRVALSVKSSGGKLSAETEKWLRVEKRRLDLMTGSASIAAKQAAEENKLTQALIKQREAAEALGTANARKAQSNINGVFGVGTSALNSGAGTSALVADYDRLLAKYDRMSSATTAYKTELADLQRAELNGIISKRQLAKAVDDLETEYRQFANGTANVTNRFVQFDRALQTSQKGARRFELGVQQAGYQIGDFAVQVQSGTNPLVAFSQQFAQMAGFFGPWGAAIGAGVAIITGIGAAFMRTSESSNIGKASLDQYGVAVKGLTEATKELVAEQERLRFGGDPELKAEAEIGKLETKIKSATMQLEALDNILESTLNGAEWEGALIDADLLDSQKQELEGQLSSLEAQLEVYRALQEAAEMLNGKNSSAKVIQDTLIAKKLEEFALYKAQVASQDMLNGLLQLSVDLGTGFSNINLSSGVAAAANSAAALARNLGVSLAVASKMMTLGYQTSQPVVFDPRDPRYDAGAAARASNFGFKPNSVSPFDPSRITSGISSGAGSSGGGSGGGGSNPIADLQKQIDLEKELTNKTEAQKKVISALGMEWKSYSPEVISGLETQIQKQLDLNKEIEEQQGLYDSVSSAMEDSFMSIITRTETVEEAFRSMAYNIIEELYKVLVVQRMVGSFDAASSTGSGLVGLLSGVFSGRASGGSVRAGQPYLVGEKGPELIVPKHSGTVVNSQQTGAMGGASSQTVVNEISVVGSDAAAVRREVAKMVPQIVEATKAAMMDSKRRGGQMASAFR
jgi:hypothetical protein